VILSEKYRAWESLTDRNLRDPIVGFHNNIVLHYGIIA
jgi:hypothetical protein